MALVLKPTRHNVEYKKPVGSTSAKLVTILAGFSDFRLLEVVSLVVWEKCQFSLRTSYGYTKQTSVQLAVGGRFVRDRVATYVTVARDKKPLGADLTTLPNCQFLIACLVPTNNGQ